MVSIWALKYSDFLGKLHHEDLLHLARNFRSVRDVDTTRHWRCARQLPRSHLLSRQRRVCVLIYITATLGGATG